MKVKPTQFLLIALVLGALILCAIPLRPKLKRVGISLFHLAKGRKSIADRVAEFGPSVHQRLAPSFEKVKVQYPPKKLVLVGFKEERRLEVWVAGEPGLFRFLKSYPILAASGTLGPKLTEGDRQVPEGIYNLESLNPNSLYHLSLRVGFPNEFDKQKAVGDGRSSLGTDVMIHGSQYSAGCLAMGDMAAEDLFVLAAETGIENTQIILSPVDFRKKDRTTNSPPWISELYAQIKSELQKLGVEQ